MWIITHLLHVAFDLDQISIDLDFKFVMKIMFNKIEMMWINCVYLCVFLAIRYLRFCDACVCYVMVNLVAMVAQYSYAWLFIFNVLL